MLSSMTFIHHVLIVITLILNLSNADIIWSEKMDLSSIPSTWNISGPGIITPTSSGGSNCPQSTGYCWELTTSSFNERIITALYGTPIDTTGYINVEFTGSVAVPGTGGSNRGTCSIQYTLTGQATSFQTIQSYSRSSAVNVIISAWNGWLGAADQNANGIFIQITNQRVGGQGIVCYFNEFRIEGTLAPTTANPTTEPTSDPTTEPTLNPTTASPSSPTQNPTIEPTNDPTTEPTLNPTNPKPTTTPTTTKVTTAQSTSAQTTSACPEGTAGRFGKCNECGFLEVPNDSRDACEYYQPWWLWLAQTVFGLGIVGVLIWCCRKNKKTVTVTMGTGQTQPLNYTMEMEMGNTQGNTGGNYGR